MLNNRVQLIGNLGQDPDARTMNDGDNVVNLSLATSDTWRDKATGEKRNRVEWHRVVIYNQNLCKVASEYLKKGSQIAVEGKLQTRKYTDSSGADKYTTEVVLPKFGGELKMLDSRSETRPGFSGEQTVIPGPKTHGANTAPNGAGGLNDEIPL